jgi:hypothetical protein
MPTLVAPLSRPVPPSIAATLSRSATRLSQSIGVMPVAGWITEPQSVPFTETCRKANTKPAASRTSPTPPRILFSNGLLVARRVLELRWSSADKPAHSPSDRVALVTPCRSTFPLIKSKACSCGVGSSTTGRAKSSLTPYLLIDIRVSAALRSGPPSGLQSKGRERADGVMTPRRHFPSRGSPRRR